MLRKALIVLFFGTLFSSVIFLFVSKGLNLTGLYRMARQPAFTDGWVTGKQPENRQNVTYNFNVGQRQYEGTGGVGDAFETIKVGDKVRVTYDPENPNQSMLKGNADDVLKQSLVLAGIFSLFGGFLFAVPLLRFGFLKRRSP